LFQRRDPVLHVLALDGIQALSWFVSVPAILGAFCIPTSRNCSEKWGTLIRLGFLNTRDVA
jgi:hypothetical protein